MISVVYAERPSGRDGIRDFSESLAAALNDRPGADAQLVLWRPSSGWPAALDMSTSILLQYNPFSYGRGGFAPALLAQLRRRRNAATLCVIVHEPYVPISDARSAVMGTWQRIQLRLLLQMAEAVGISAEGFRTYLPRGDRARASHVPVGSPLPDARSERDATRAALGIGEAQLVVALYGSGHQSRLFNQSAAAVTEIVEAGMAPVVLNLGHAAPSLAPVPAPARLIQPGPLPAAELAALLAAADVALLPFVDGASTRRTTMIATLQQETCVLSTCGAMTDTELANAPSPILTPVGDRKAFVDAAIELAADAARRTRAASQGRDLFERLFSWPVIAERVEKALIAGRTT